MEFWGVQILNSCGERSAGVGQGRRRRNNKKQEEKEEEEDGEEEKGLCLPWSRAWSFRALGR